MLPAAIGAFLLLWPVVWMHYGGIALVALPMLLDDERLTPTVALAWLLFAIRVAIVWLPATALLVGSAAVPSRVLAAQDRIGRWLARHAGTGEVGEEQARPAGIG
jgi:hypothetical protein